MCTLSVNRKVGFIENRRLVKTAVILSFFLSLLRKHAILRVDKDQCHRQGQRRVIEWTSLRIYRKLKISGFEKAGENMHSINGNYLPRRVLHQRLFTITSLEFTYGVNKKLVLDTCLHQPVIHRNAVPIRFCPSPLTAS